MSFPYTLQVSFSDKTELVMSSVNDTIFYRGKQGELHGYHAKEAEDFSKHPSVAKRVKHANDIIRMLVSGAPIKAWGWYVSYKLQLYNQNRMKMNFIINIVYS